MKRFIPRLIAFGILFLVAAIKLITTYSTDLLIIESAALALIALFMFCGEDQSLMKSLPAFAIGWVLFTMLIPQYPLTLDMLAVGLHRLWNIIGRPFRSQWTTIGLVAFIALQLFFRTKNQLFFIIARYVAAFVLLYGFFDRVRLGMGVGSRFVVFIVLFSLLYELRTRHHGAHKRRTLACVLTSLVFMLALVTYGPRDELCWSYVFPETRVYLRVVIGVAIVGSLLILEEYNHRTNYKDQASAFCDLGPALLFWCVLCLCMHVWPRLANWESLIILPIILYYCYSLFIKNWVVVTKGNERKAVVVSWTVITLWLLVFSKYFESNLLIVAVIVLLMIAGVACWSASTRRENRDLIMCCYYGVAAVVLLFASVFPVEYFNLDAVVVGRYILALILMAAAWCVLCSTTSRLHHNASSIYSKEYLGSVRLEKIVPVTVIAATAFLLLVR